MRTTRWIMMAVLAVILAGGPAVYAAQSNEDTPIDRIGDWFATLGKPQNEKEFIINQRKTERFAKRTGDSVERGINHVSDAINRGFYPDRQSNGERIQKEANENRTSTATPP